MDIDTAIELLLILAIATLAIYIRLVEKRVDFLGKNVLALSLHAVETDPKLKREWNKRKKEYENNGTRKKNK